MMSMAFPSDITEYAQEDGLGAELEVATKNKPKFWAIVCTDLHLVVGPYHDPRTALRDAKQLTEDNECVFRPVPMEFRGVTLTEDQARLAVAGGVAAVDDGHTGQYL